MSKSFTAQALAEALDGQLSGDGTLVINRVTHPTDWQGEHDLALAMDKKILPLLEKTQALVALISQDATPPAFLKACIAVKRPRLALAKLTQLFAEPTNIAQGIHPTALIDPTAKLGTNVTVGAYTTVGARTVIGANSVIHSHTSIGADTTIGDDALIYAGVRLADRITIGNRVIIHYNTTIGADGFSFVTPQAGSVEEAKSTGTGEVSQKNQELIRIASVGTVIISDDVEIGANSSIDRGTIAATRIGKGTKIDNQVQIGHNVVIGENCMLCGRVGIAGSVVIGDRVVMGGASGAADHVTIGDDALIMAMSGIAGNILPRTIVGGVPALPRQRLIENMFNLNRIKAVIGKVEVLTARLDKIEPKT